MDGDRLVLEREAKAERQDDRPVLVERIVRTEQLFVEFDDVGREIEVRCEVVGELRREVVADPQPVRR